MFVNDFFGERLNRPTGGDELVQNFGAFVFALNHRLHAFELAGDFAQTNLQSAAIRLGVVW